MKVLKVLMVGPGNGVVGGIAAVVKTLVPTLRQQIDFSYVPMTKQRLHKGKAAKVTIVNLVAIVRQYVHFLIALLRFRPNVVHLHTSQGTAWLKDTYYVVVSRLFGVPFVLHVHAADMDRLYAKRPPWYQWYTRKIMSMASVIIAVSEQWRQQLGQIVPSERIHTFRNCVDVSAFSSCGIQSGNSEANILFLGSVGPRKGIYDLLPAAKRLKDNGRSFNMTLAGYEEAEGEMARATHQIETEGLQAVCHLPGIVTGEQKNRLILEADIFALPSYNEGLPIALLEAMAAGMAIITTPVGGIPEVIIDGYNGFLVAPGNVAELTEKLTILVNDQVLRQEMGWRNRKFAEQELDVKPYASRLISLYETVTYR